MSVYYHIENITNAKFSPMVTRTNQHEEHSTNNNKLSGPTQTEKFNSPIVPKPNETDRRTTNESSVSNEMTDMGSFQFSTPVNLRNTKASTFQSPFERRMTQSRNFNGSQPMPSPSKFLENFAPFFRKLKLSGESSKRKAADGCDVDKVTPKQQRMDENQHTDRNGAKLGEIQARNRMSDDSQLYPIMVVNVCVGDPASSRWEIRNQSKYGFTVSGNSTQFENLFLSRNKWIYRFKVDRQSLENVEKYVEREHLNGKNWEVLLNIDNLLNSSEIVFPFALDSFELMKWVLVATSFGVESKKFGGNCFASCVKDPNQLKIALECPVTVEKLVRNLNKKGKALLQKIKNSIYTPR